VNDATLAASLKANAWRLLNGLRPRAIDLHRAELLRNAALDSLRSADRLERLLLELGLNDEGLNEFPVELHPYCGQGLLIWQFPIQFGPYLAELTRHRIGSYLEIGVRHGGSFVTTVELLRRFDPDLRSVGVDIIPSASMVEYANAHPQSAFVCINTMSDAFDALVQRLAPLDLVFIDSHHEESQCRSEFERVRPYANIIALHDIANSGCPGVGTVWGEIAGSGDYDCHTFTEQYAAGPHHYMGIGLAVRKERLHR
jgi:hypothetical protein